MRGLWSFALEILTRPKRRHAPGPATRIPAERGLNGADSPHAPQTAGGYRTSTLTKCVLNRSELRAPCGEASFPAGCTTNSRRNFITQQRVLAVKGRSILLLFGLFLCVTDDCHAGSSGGLRKKMDGKKISAVEILDSAGVVAEEIAAGANDYARGGRRYRRLITALEAEQEGSIVVVDTTIDLDERNPYMVVRSTTTKIRWLDSRGGLRCELAGGRRTGVVAVSKNGKNIAVLHAGFDPIEFEKMNEGAAGNSLESLRSDTELTMNRLEIFNAGCERIWSATGGVSEFGNVTFSPNGKWLLYRAHHPSNDANKRTQRKFEVVNLDGNAKFNFLANKTPADIADDGTVEILEHIGRGSGFRTINSTNGKSFNIPKKRFKIKTWQPGQSEFLESGRHREE